ncbi:type I methionyl aminopeptidase [candidate division WWE3 bacterium CG_4_9_14_0_2_um_filter_35_11]|uniref:Methionine aminopeptidase n=1 Tax=candidate division WWE3 bacterium CG_4_9_14_0_2_um_filter_35_11 TaxID=1975077 RepID=A0A2M8EKT3_UNCKA|nr:MAG: type I methionyl aminopeptidase [candidate division WWE3 bacterium CG10_big_fil_rev_8_21_14_0_10_35_32]PJC23354.1 MAG: type I methionyl aminopeptidase [candidate division WWE3 bacterium CG_4_9_14_0_2_um_filter_35_11]
MIYIKSIEDINNLRIGGKISANIMNNALKMVVPGVSTFEINEKIEKLMKKEGVVPWFKEIDNYPYATCISVNEAWIHGMPSKYKLKHGDIVSIDLGVKYGKYYIDHCWTVVATNSHSDNPMLDLNHDDSDIAKFLKVGVESLEKAISNFVEGLRVGDISSTMQQTVENAGYSVVREYTGHGVGIKAHEDPLIACYGTKGAGELLKNGMVFAIEVMYAIGNSKIVVGNDGWTVSTKDKKISGMFEHTVALTENGPEILTI